MVTEKLLDKPAGLAGFRARRAALKEERRRQKASDNFTAKAPDCGREIPPRLNPDVPDMVDQVKSCYAGLTKWIEEFQHVIAELRDHDLLDPCESAGLLKHYDQLQEAVDAATEAILRSAEVATGRKPHAPKFDANLIADHAKYVYAVGTRDIAAMQYLLAELAGTGRIDHKEQHELQWGHCLGMWQTLYHGTTCAVRDDRTWDGAMGMVRQHPQRRAPGHGPGPRQRTGRNWTATGRTTSSCAATARSWSTRGGRSARSPR